MGILRPDGARIPVRDVSARVAVVYEHPLLGEGVARLVRAGTGADVVAVAGDDPPALAGVLAIGPWVVLVERGPLLDDLDLTDAAPAATVIDLPLHRGARDPLRGKPPDIPDVIADVVAALARQSRARVARLR